MKNRRELFRYVFWGILSMLLNIGMAQVLVLTGLDYKISNAITLITVKLFCYMTNKLFVFRTPFGDIRTFIKELLNFILARWITFLADYFGVILLVDVWKQSFFVSKCFLSVFVVILNFILSKWVVFRRKTESSALDGKRKEE